MTELPVFDFEGMLRSVVTMGAVTAAILSLVWRVTRGQ